MPKYIKTPEELREGFILRLVDKLRRERELKERVEYLERVNKIQAKRIERLQKRGVFNE